MVTLQSLGKVVPGDEAIDDKRKTEFVRVSEAYPVLVFVPGLSYQYGSASLYDGSVLAARGRLIVVTLNYRLGLLGFFNPNIDVSGRATVANYGIMDQLAALHWVQENIVRFGGDPGQVTVMGHGTGAASLNFLVISPAATGAGLFKRSILMSGSALSPWALVERPSHFAKRAAKQLGCEVNSDFFTHYEALLHCLRDRSVEEILEVEIETPKFRSSVGPSIDGVTIKPNWQQHLSNMGGLLLQMLRNAKLGEGLFLRVTSTAINTLHNLSFSFPSLNGKEGRTPVDILMGVSEKDIYQLFNEGDILNGFAEETRDKILRTYVVNNYRFHLQEIVLAVTAEYTEWSRPIQHPITIRDLTAEAINDASLVAPACATVAQLSSAMRSSYFYVFSPFHGSEQTKPEVEYPLNELAFVFGEPLGASGHFSSPLNYSRAEIILSEAVIAFWSNFARTGNPNNPGNGKDIRAMEKLKYRTPLWPSYDPMAKKYLDFGASRGKARDHYRASHVALWTWLLPSLERVGARFGPDSTFHRFTHDQEPFTFSGPTRSWVSSQEATEIPGISSTLRSITSTNTNSPFLTGQHPSLRSVDLTAPLETDPYKFSEFSYTTALSLTIAIGCSLLVLNLLVFAAVYYRKESPRSNSKCNEAHGSSEEGGTDKISSGRGFKTSPSQCGTLRSSVTLRSSLANSCEEEQPHEWPPDYMTCYSQEVIEGSQQPPNGTTVLGNIAKPPPPPRSTSVPSQVEAQPLLSPVTLLQDKHSNIPTCTEMRL